MSGVSTPELLQEVEERAEKIELIHMNYSLVENRKELFFALIMMLRGPALTLVRHVEPTNGYECWRVFHRRYERRDEQTMMGFLQTIIKFDCGTDLTKILDKIGEFELLVDRYEVSVGDEVFENFEWLSLEKDYQNR